METRKRTVVKSITFRIIATIATVILVIAFTGDMAIAGLVGGLDLISKLIIYYLHERTWGKIRWGKRRRKIQLTF